MSKSRYLLKAEELRAITEIHYNCAQSVTVPFADVVGLDEVAMLKEIYRRVRDNHEGFLDCADLLRINAQKGLEKKPHCDAMVYELVGITEELLCRYGKIT